MLTRHTLTDEQWNRIEELLPSKLGDPGRSGRGDRLFVEAVLFIANSLLSDREDRRAMAGLARTIWKLELDLAAV